VGKSGLPERGIAAHRGGAASHPENTLAAFRHAAALGVHQIEFDVRRSRDGQVVVIHDADVERTTDGKGRVANLTETELRALDAGSWKNTAFSEERIPTLAEALEALPRDVWINVQIKKDEPVANEVGRAICESDRVHQAFVACGNAAARTLRKLHPQIVICNLVRKRTRAQYVEHAIATGSDFVQFHHQRGAPEPELVARAKSAGLRINYFCNAQSAELGGLFEAGVDFVLVDDLADALAQARTIGIAPLAR
jgi:glycerophosphoryl diester phosphodiesterase